MTPEEALIAYGKAWFERDQQRRVEALRECCTEDIVFMDPRLGRLHGLEAVAEMIGGYISDRPAGDATSKGSERGRSDGSVGVEVVTPIETFHGYFRYSFVWILPDGTRSGGTDFCEVAEDGRMKLITVWPASEAFPVPTAT
jgi:hypothetical protein